MAYWKKIEFWNKLRETFMWSGTIGTGGMAGADATHMANVPSDWIAYTAGAALIGAVISHFTKIWFEDKDGDGLVDIFQKNL